MVAGLVVLSMAACGTTVRHHTLSAGQSGSLSAAQSGLAPATADGGAATSGDQSSGTADATGTTTTPGTTGGGSATTTGAATTVAGTGTATGTGTTTPAAGTATAPAGVVTSAAKTPAATTKTTATKTGTKTEAKSSTKATASASAAAPVTTGKATGSPIEIGVTFITDVSSLSVGATAGNEQTEAQAAVDYVNAHGGLAGHVLDMIPYNFQLADTSPYSTSMAAICSSWTQDNHVSLGMFVGAAVPDDLANCLNQHGVAYMSDGGFLHDATTYKQLPNFISPTELDTSVAAQAILNNLFATNALTTKDKVGVMVGDNEDPAGRAYTNVIAPALKAKGISVASYAVTFPDSTADAANSLVQIDNDELHMATDGVTRVIFLAPNTAGSFMSQADQQKYFPKYSLTTYDNPVGLTGSSGSPADQLVNTSGIGWNPSTDVGTYGSTAYDNATTKLCRTIEAPTGQDTSLLSEYATQVFCNAILSVQAAANAAGPSSPLTGGAFIGGFNALGNSFQDSLTLGTTFSSTKHYGDSLVRPFAYSPTCSCFNYTGAAAAIS